MFETTKDVSAEGEAAASRIYTPAVDIIERKDEILMAADMPGVDEKSLDVTLEKDVLTIYGKVEAEKREGYEPVAAEYGNGDYRRVFSISDRIDRERIAATVKNGVLRIVLPKAEAARAKKIVVAVEDGDKEKAEIDA